MSRCVAAAPLVRFHRLPASCPGFTMRTDMNLRGAAAVLCLALAGAVHAQTLVERGEYLARAGDCVSCHTATGGPPFAGGLRIDTPFGYMLTPNITPDADTGIGRWSSGD